MTTKHTRRTPRVDPGPFGPWIASWRLALRADSKSPRTVKIYIDAVTLLAGYLQEHHTTVADWDDVTRTHLREFWVWMTDCGWARSSINQNGRSLQQFFAWRTVEEGIPNVMAGVRPPAAPKLGERVPPVIDDADMSRLIKDAESGKNFESRRDAALLRLFASSGARLEEVARLSVSDVNVESHEALVTGKGRKQRWIKFDRRAALAIDRYLRMRAQHRAVRELGVTALWIGTRRLSGMTPAGIYQVVTRRGRRIGLKLNPHRFRHNFAHRWQDRGGAEGDLMELAGWESPQMLRHYGASARSARARRAYDRVEVMGGI